MSKSFWLFFVFCFSLAIYMPAPGFAANKSAPARIKLDTTKFVVKHFDAKALDNYRHDKDFNYTGEAVGEPTFWDIFWNWLWGKIYALFDGIPYAGSFFKYLLLGLSITLLIYIIFKSLGIDAIQLLKGNSRLVDIPFSESLENIHEINFDAEIDKAVSQNNFRLAVRLLYLKCLKQLSDRGLINWQINKTNSNYVFELEDSNQRETFSLLTNRFEYVWYGEFFIDKNAFADINLLFQNFSNFIK